MIYRFILSLLEELVYLVDLAVSCTQTQSKILEGGVSELSNFRFLMAPFGITISLLSSNSHTGRKTLSYTIKNKLFKNLKFSHKTYRTAI